MASTRLFGNRIPPACRYCEAGCGFSAVDGTVLCEKKGVVAADYRCRHYRYDPLKREPKRRARVLEHSEKDFSL